MGVNDVEWGDFFTSGSVGSPASSGSSGNTGSNGSGAAPSIDYGYDEPEVFWGGNPPDDPPASTFTPVPSVDYGFDASGNFTGEGWGGNPPPPPGGGNGDEDVSGLDFLNDLPGSSPGGNGGNGGDGSGLPGGGTDTGSGSDGGSGSGSKPPGIYTTHLVDLFNEITGGNVLEGGIGNLRELSRDTLSLSDQNMMKNLGNQDTQNPYVTPNPLNTSTIQPNDYTIMKPTINAPTTEPNIKEPTIKDKTGWQYNITDPFNVGYQFNENVGVNAGFNPLNQSGSLMLNLALGGNKAQGGPVGLMSLPQGYENGGEVIEGEDTMEELTPFGGTREQELRNIWDQVEAFDNAPHHIEEPMIGMWGEKIPLTTARRVQGYMEGLDPVKRNLIQEMMQMFQMKKMQEKQQDQEQRGQYFGPRPEEYAI